MSALTQLTHQVRRSSVNFSHHVQPQSALGTNVCGWSGPCLVDIAIQAEADGFTFEWPFAHYMPYYSPQCRHGT